MNLIGKLHQTFELAFGIEPKEFNLVQFFFLYITIISAGYTLSSTAAVTLFLSRLSENALHQQLPWLYISNAITISCVAWGFGKCVDQFSRIKLITITTVFFILSFILIRLLIGMSHQTWIYFFFMVWDETCSVVLIMAFFSYLGDYFLVENAKRLFGYIAGGMALGAPIGGFGSAILLHYIQPANLLFVSIFLLLLSNLVAFIIWKYGIRPKKSEKIMRNSESIAFRKLIFHPYLNPIFMAAIAASICTAIEVYQLFFITSKTLNAQAIGLFMGHLFGYIGMAQLFIDFVLARWLFKYIGVLNILLLLPIMFVLLGFGFILYPALLLAAGIKFLDASFSGTLGNIATQILLLPLPDKIRLHSQSILTGVMGTTARVIGGVILLIFSFFVISVRYYSIIILIAALFWFINIIRLMIQYKNKAYHIDI